MANDIKKNGTYDGRTKSGRQSNGKTLAPKTTVRKMTSALGNNRKTGK